MSSPTTSPSTLSGTIDRRQLLQAGCAAVLVAKTQRLCGADGAASTPSSVLGINLADVNYYMSERPFNNLFLTASEPIPQRRGLKWGEGGALQRDAQGWVERYQPQQFAAFLIDLKAGHPKGVYRVTYRGDRSAIDVDGKASNQMIKDQERQRMIVRCFAPIRDVVVKEVTNASEETFAQPFVERCRKFAVLRFMDWQHTNKNEYRPWPERITPDYRTQSEFGVSLEYMVELCNVTRSAMWYCVHHLASDDDIRESARFVKSQLDPGIPVYLEHSNEVWNGGFPQHKFAKAQDKEFYKYHVQRTAQAARIWRQEGVELQCVLGLQASNTWLSGQVYKQGLPAEINAVAIAPYFAGEVGRGEDGDRVLLGGTDYIIDSIPQDLKNVREIIQKQKELADAAKVPLIGYEGGSHMVGVYPQLANDKFNEILISANRRPEMYDFFREYLDIWDQETDRSLMCLYHSVSTPTKHGAWGLMEYEGQSLDQAHKYRAVLERLPAARS